MKMLQVKNLLMWHFHKGLKLKAPVQSPVAVAAHPYTRISRPPLSKFMACTILSLSYAPDSINSLSFICFVALLYKMKIPIYIYTSEN